MEKKRLFETINVKVLLIAVALLFFGGAVNATDLAFTPSTQQINVGETFQVNVSIVDVIDLYSYQFDMLYDSSVILFNGTVIYGPFLGDPHFEVTPGAGTVPGFIDNYGATRMSSLTGVTGTGLIATFYFDALSEGVSNLNFINTYMYDSSLSTNLPHNNLSGSVTVVAASICTNPDGDAYDNCTLAQGGDANDLVDCNNSDPAINPGATEICNGVDDDCNALTLDGSGEAAPTNTLQDGVCAASTQSCISGSWTDDYSGIATYEAGTETLCDGLDNDCDASIDELLETTYYQDVDGDSYGNLTSTTLACTSPVGYVLDSADCNDNNGAINPGATEICNGVDDDCSNGVDVNSTGDNVCSIDNYYCDSDTDGYNSSIPSGSCSTFNCIPAGCSSIAGGDCDDNNISINPGATEICNGVDDDCDSVVDEGVQTTFYYDFDSDGYGDNSTTALACSLPTDYVANDLDCNDNDGAINPGATEICNGVDDNCDGSIDEGVCGTTDYYCDGDSDTYYSEVVSGSCSGFSCEPASCVLVAGNDCDDSNLTINPGATEICNGVDDNCDGSIDEGCAAPASCVVTNAYWNETNVEEDTLVELIVTGTDCDGNSVDFYIMEDDALEGPDWFGGNDDPIEGVGPSSATFSGGVATSTWYAQWQDDGAIVLLDDSPEYYFRAEVNGTNYSSSDYNSELTVTLTQRKYELKDIVFNPGKNSFSLPLVLDNYSISDVFSGIEANFDRMYTYDGGFKIHNFDGRPSNLYDLEVGKGYIIWANTPTTLTINGSKRDENLQRPVITLIPGWNFIGTFSNPYQAQDLLQNVPYNELYTYDDVLGDYVVVGLTDNLDGEKGYWIYINQSTNVTFIPVTGQIIGE